ncbi:MAG: hypothetical protein AAFZ65_09500 [Planctomycetota bacterium]
MKQSTLLPLLSLPFLATSASAQLVAVTGTDLAAMAATAADGETIIIQSDDTFVGTLEWTSKTLTIRAGLGFTPTVKGDPGSAAVNNAGDEMVGIFRDLRFEPGDPLVVTPAAVSLSGTSGSPEVATLELIDCRVDGRLSVVGTGFLVQTLTLRGTESSDELDIGGTGSREVEVQVLDQSRVRGLDVGPTGNPTIDLLVRDSRVEGPTEIDPVSSSGVTANFRRARLEGQVSIEGSSSGGVDVITDALLESCLILGDGTGVGLFTDTRSNVRGVNLTVTGFGTGLETNVGTTLDNLLVYGNGDDLDDVVLQFQIANSLIEDGTYAGLFGNVAGTPIVDQAYFLYETSPGIDAGDSSVPELDNTDVKGDPRVQDGDGDGNARVNLGAVESVRPCGAASVAPLNGSGTNPSDLSVVGAPLVGQPLNVDITTAPATVATVVAIGLPSPTPLALPGFDGELLLAPAPSPILDTALGSHAIQIPGNGNYCGQTIAIQGVRGDVGPGGVELRFTNGALLTLGV